MQLLDVQTSVRKGLPGANIFLVNVLLYKYERLRPERLVLCVLICPYTVYIWARRKWEYTEDCEKALVSTVFYYKSGYMPVFHERESSCFVNSDIHIQLLCVCLHQFPLLHSMVHFRIVVLYKVIAGGKANLTYKCFVSKSSKHRGLNNSQRDRL